MAKTHHPKKMRTVAKRTNENPGQMITIRVSEQFSNRKMHHVPICPVKHTHTSMLMYISGKMSICDPIGSLYDLKGKEINLPEQLNHDQHYVGRANCHDQASQTITHPKMVACNQADATNITQLPMPLIQSQSKTTEICCTPIKAQKESVKPLRRLRLPSYYRSQLDLLETQMSETKLEPARCEPTLHQAPVQAPHHKQSDPFHPGRKRHRKKHLNCPAEHHMLPTIHNTVYHANHPPHHKHLNVLPSYKSKPELKNQNIKRKSKNPVRASHKKCKHT